MEKENEINKNELKRKTNDIECSAENNEILINKNIKEFVNEGE